MKSVLCAIGFASIASAAAVHAEAAVHARDGVQARDVANAAKAAHTFTSTDVETTTQGCYAAIPTTAPGFQCNVEGTIGHPNMIDDQTLKPLQECQDLCLFDETCLVYGYNKKTNECQTFKKSLKQMNFDDTVASGFVYSNRHCLTCDYNPPPVSSSTSATTTSKSTSAKHSHTHAVSSSSSVSSSTHVHSSSSSSSKNSTSAPKPKPTKSKSSSSSLTSVSTSSSASSTKTKASKTKSTAVASASANPVNGHATCTASSVAIPQSTQTYTQYFVGAGVTENPVNPGNDNSQQAPINSTLSGSYGSDCDAIAACANSANFAAYQYYSFDLHFVNSTQQWVCTQYYDPNTKPEYFNVKNDDVVVAYGYYNPNF